MLRVHRVQQQFTAMQEVMHQKSKDIHHIDFSSGLHTREFKKLVWFVVLSEKSDPDATSATIKFISDVILCNLGSCLKFIKFIH